MTHSSTLMLKPIPPYDFDLTGSIFSSGDPQICRYEHGHLWQVIRVGNKLLLVTARSTGSVEAPELSITLESASPQSTELRGQAGRFMYGLLNLGLDLKPFYRAAKRDPVLREITKAFKGLRFMKTASVFEALVYAICEQQISLTVTRSIENKIVKAFGEQLKIGGKTYYAFPTPRSLASVSMENLRACGLSQKKAEYVRDMSLMVAQRQLNPDTFLTYESMDDIIKELTAIRGIGLWTAEYVLIRGMARLEAMPADDLGLRRSISHYYFHGEKIFAGQARAVAEGWGRWRGLASFYLLSAMRLSLKR